MSESNLEVEIEVNSDKNTMVAEFQLPLYHGKGEVKSAEEIPSDSISIYGLAVRYSVGADRKKQFLKVLSSKFELRVHTAPGIRFEFESTYNRKPAAHVHFSGIGGLLSPALMRNYASQTGRKKKEFRHGEISKLHFPVGGHRFRPSLEDFLYFVIEECGFLALEGWETRLRKTREVWLDTQLRAAVRDHPEVAAESLTAMGYVVKPPDGCHPPECRHESW